MKEKIVIEQECPSCYGYGYVALECCNGHRCSCNGQPVEMECHVCETTGKINEKSDLSANFNFIFDNNLLYLGDDLGGRAKTRFEYFTKEYERRCEIGKFVKISDAERKEIFDF